MFDFEAELKKLPHKPGIYMMRDRNDTIIYVGKAIHLKNRVRSYFRESTVKSPKIQKMVSLITRFEYIVTDSELEALVLENNLIKEHSPKYNTLLKDDKTYPYIKVTLGEDYPRVLFVRQMKKDGSKYYGPFTNATAVKDAIELINKLCLLRTCNRNISKEASRNQKKNSQNGQRNDRACLNYDMKQCSGPCQEYVSKEQYQTQVQKAIECLNGNYSTILKELEAKMNEASDQLAFEEAITYRELIASVKAVAQKQKITDSDGEDKDIIALCKDENDAVVQVFFVRNGRLIGREHFYMTHIADTSKDQILQSFIKQFYAGTPFIPRELMIQESIEELEIIQNWLSIKKGSKVKISVPKIGYKEKLVELAAKNATLVLSQDREKMKREEGRTIGAVKEIGALLNIDYPLRMEAYDISNISGFENVGSMVVYEKGKPKRSDYRKFKIKTVSGPDDYACMKELLTRRFQHGLEEKKELKEKEMDQEFGSFTKFPNLILMDGGKGQVNIALEVLSELGLSIPVCGMVKDDNHRTRGLFFNNQEIMMDHNSEGFKLITRIQDEAHRFAITFHRCLRSKTQVRSALDHIPGIGPSRRKALMKYFQSMEEIKNASKETLMNVPSITEKVAEDIMKYFQKNSKKES